MYTFLGCLSGEQASLDNPWKVVILAGLRNPLSELMNWETPSSCINEIGRQALMLH